MPQLPFHRTIQSFRIFNLIDPTEFYLLTDLNKDIVRIILSLGVVDVNEGTNARELLWVIFPEGSVTGDRLRDPANRIVYIPQEPEE